MQKNNRHSHNHLTFVFISFPRHGQILTHLLPFYDKEFQNKDCTASLLYFTERIEGLTNNIRFDKYIIMITAFMHLFEIIQIIVILPKISFNLIFVSMRHGRRNGGGGAGGDGCNCPPPIFCQPKKLRV